MLRAACESTRCVDVANIWHEILDQSLHRLVALKLTN